MASFQEAFAVKESLVSSLLQQENISGVGIGFLNPDNEEEGAAIILYVNAESISATNLPEYYEAYINETDIRVPIRKELTGEFIANVNFLAGHPEYSKRIRPILAGYSVGYPGSSGTAGLIVIDKVTKKLFILSNNHVLNKDNTSGYTETIQPGGADGGSAGADTIGRLDRYIPFVSGDNYLDAATSIPLNNSLLNPSYATKGTIPGHYLQYRVGWNFYKVGRTTGPVTGKVDSVDTQVTVDYGRLGKFTFKQQTVVKGAGAVSLPGDSGSVWLKAEDNNACAVNYAGSGDGLTSICFPINWFMEKFNCLVALPSLVEGNILVPFSNPSDPILSRFLLKEVLEFSVVEAPEK
jgi:hypothetical protein